MRVVPVKERGKRLQPAPHDRLVDACRRQDRAALEHVFREHGPMLHRLLMRLLGAGSDVDDVFQTTIVLAIRAFPKFRGEASFETWLSRIAINAARSHLRSKRTPGRATLELIGDEASDPAPSPDRVVDDRARLDRLHHHRSALSAEKRIAFLLHVVHGMSVEDVAALTGTAVFATKSRIYWAGRALRNRARRDPLLRGLLLDADEGMER
jgi:RNA polymerase sigma-70 factor (ECF subfamily)